MKNYLSDKFVYLAGPMYSCQDDGVTWRAHISPKLVESYGLTVLDPTTKTANGLGEVKDDKKNFRDIAATQDFALLKKSFSTIVRKDLRCVDKSDFLIVVYDPVVPSVGTIHEMVEATRQKKPVLIKYDSNYSAEINPWVLTFTKPHLMFSEWDDMFTYLNDINNNKFTEPDLDYWTLED